MPKLAVQLVLSTMALFPLNDISSRRHNDTLQKHNLVTPPRPGSVA